MKEQWTVHAYRCDFDLDGWACPAQSPGSEDSWADAHHHAEQAGWFIDGDNAQFCPEHNPR